MSEADAVRAITGRVEHLGATDWFSGAVLVVKGDRVLVSLTQGQAEKAFAAPNRIDTKFNLGSMNKMFTAISIAELVEKGKLAFTDTLIKVLPDYPNKAFAESVTLHQLLTHTSGIGGTIFAPPVFEHRDKYKRPTDYIPLFANEPPEFPPGARFSYANQGFMILGAIVERISGENYFDYVQNHVFAPAGMQHTASYAWNEVTPNLAVGYVHDESDVFALKPRGTNVATLPFRGSPAGGGYSTVQDLRAFADALRAHKLLSATMTETVTSPKVDIPEVRRENTATALARASSTEKKSAGTAAARPVSTARSISSGTAATSSSCSATTRRPLRKIWPAKSPNFSLCKTQNSPPQSRRARPMIGALRAHVRNAAACLYSRCDDRCKQRCAHLGKAGFTLLPSDDRKVCSFRFLEGAVGGDKEMTMNKLARISLVLAGAVVFPAMFAGACGGDDDGKGSGGSGGATGGSGGSTGGSAGSGTGGATGGSAGSATGGTGGAGGATGGTAGKAGAAGSTAAGWSRGIHGRHGRQSRRGGIDGRRLGQRRYGRQSRFGGSERAARRAAAPTAAQGPRAPAVARAAWRTRDATATPDRRRRTQYVHHRRSRAGSHLRQLLLDLHHRLQTHRHVDEHFCRQGGMHDGLRRL